MDKVEEMIEELGLTGGEFDGNTYIVTFDSSDLFANAFNQISDKLIPDEEGNVYSDSNSMVVFTDENVEVITNADYDNDQYTISIGEK